MVIDQGGRAQPGTGLRPGTEAHPAGRVLRTVAAPAGHANAGESTAHRDPLAAADQEHGIDRHCLGIRHRHTVLGLERAASLNEAVHFERLELRPLVEVGN
jgi:hypothetical protein